MGSSIPVVNKALKDTINDIVVEREYLDSSMVKEIFSKDISEEQCEIRKIPAYEKLLSNGKVNSMEEYKKYILEGVKSFKEWQ